MKKLFILFILLRLPYLIAEYPGCIYPDTAGSIDQFFGHPDFSAQLCSTDPTVVLTNHHPVIYTLLFGGTIWLGQAAGNPSAAVFVFVLLQAVIHSWLLARLFMMLRPQRAGKALHLWRACIAFSALFPIYGFWSTLMLKDAFFSLCTIWLLTGLLEIVQSDGHKLNNAAFLLRFFAMSFLFMLSKNQCAYIVLIMILLVVAFYRVWRWRMASVMGAALLAYGLWLHVLLPSLHVALSGRQELHGFMFQQSARYLKEYPADVSASEKAAINAVLPYDSLASLYNPDLQDPVKFHYKVGATDAAFAQYRIAHLRMMLRHPDIAVLSVWQGCNAYFYPSARFPLFFPSLSTETQPLRAVKPLCSPQPSGMMTILSVPVLGLFFDMGLYIPLALLGCLCLLLRRRWNHLLVMLPILISICILIISPENGCFRYVMPILWALPLEALLVFGDLSSHNYELSNGRQKELKGARGR
ncbi:MAG: hypothetical protein IJV06_01350 [Bacteroidaceae bacterium]|nr:hypothetical protein [Bacteroidaceae bacterium]